MLLACPRSSMSSSATVRSRRKTGVSLTMWASVVQSLARAHGSCLRIAQMALPVALEQLIGAERLALLREVALVPRDLTAVVPEARPGEDVVVLVHGFLASAGVFRPLRARLERESGARVATFTHAPGLGVRRIAKQLAAIVDRIPRGTRITVVGHSLGGLVARWY